MKSTMAIDSIVIDSEEEEKTVEDKTASGERNGDLKRDTC